VNGGDWRWRACWRNHSLSRLSELQNALDMTRARRSLQKFLFTVHRSPFTFFLHLALALLPSCTLPPLRGKIDVGQEPFAVFVGGTGPKSDLYAVRIDGGTPYPITYTPVAELAPALGPNGTDLAFLRSASLRDSTPSTLWVMNLLNGSERELELPQDAGTPSRVGWSRDGRSLIVETGRGLYQLDAPPSRRPNPRLVPKPERMAAESSLAVLLGDPVFTRVVSCRARDLCVIGRRGKPGLLAQSARDPVRWGSDSVAFFVGDRLQIRPLRRGRPRLLLWSNGPERPRDITFFPGLEAVRSER
jgi:hypothetical protein